MFIHCRNDKCKNYYEDGCMKNMENKMVCFDENGHCEDFEEIKEPVTFMEAVESGKRIKSKQWDSYQTLDDTLFILAKLSRKDKKERILGKWYIE